MKVGRNDPCPCGSGKKYKKCCLGKKDVSVDLLWRRLGEAHDRLAERLMSHAAKVFGEEAFSLAMEEFFCWPDDEETLLDVEPHEQLFFPWFLFEWVYDPEEFDIELQVPVNVTVAQSYMEQKRDRLDPVERRLIEEVTNQPYSFFEVMDSRAGQGYRLQDVLRGGEAVDVIEKTGSSGAHRGDLLFGRVVQIDAVALVIGCGSILIPPRLKTEVIRFRTWLLEGNDPITTDTLYEYDMELRDLYLTIFNALTAPPQLQNTDGEPLVFHTLHYEIDSAQQAFERLKTLCVVETEKDLRAVAQIDGRGHIRRVIIPWSRKRSGQGRLAGDTVLGRIEIDGQRLRVEVNSARRAETIQAEIEKRLGRHARYKTTQLSSAESMLEADGQPPLADPGSQAPGENLMQLPEVQQQVGRLLKTHWRGWIDEAIPALGGQTPRQAVKTADGREAVEALLLDAKRNLKDHDPMAEIERTAIVDVRRRLKLDTGGGTDGSSATSRQAEAVRELIRDFGRTGLDERYIALALKLCNRIARMRKLSIQRGRVEIWAAAILHVIAGLNFLFDPANDAHITAEQLNAFFNTKKSTVTNKASQIRTACNLYIVSEEFSVPEIAQMFRFYETEEGFLVSGSMLDAPRDEAGPKGPIRTPRFGDKPSKSTDGPSASRKTKSAPKSDDRQRKLFDDF